MKLNTQQIETVEQITGVQPIPDGVPALNELQSAFGDHTFYLTTEGLLIWEWLEGAEADGQPVIAVQLATWTDEEKNQLAVQEPKPTEIVIRLDAPDTGGTVGTA